MKKLISILITALLTMLLASSSIASSSLLYCDTVVLEATTQVTREEVLTTVKDAALAEKEKNPTVVYEEVKTPVTEVPVATTTLKGFFQSRF